MAPKNTQSLNAARPVSAASNSITPPAATE